MNPKRGLEIIAGVYIFNFNSPPWGANENLVNGEKMKKRERKKRKKKGKKKEKGKKKKKSSEEGGKLE